MKLETRNWIENKLPSMNPPIQHSSTPVLQSLLRCPVCATPLRLEKRTHRCEKGHSFDLSKEGYVNLLLSHQRKSKNPGDDKMMIQARRRFFDSGAFDPLVKLILEKGLRPEALDFRNSTPPKPQASGLQPIAFPSILDCGCGEGHLLGTLSTSLRSDSPLRSPSFGGQAVGVSRHSLLTTAEDVAPPLNSDPTGRVSLSRKPSTLRGERAEKFFGVDVSKEAIRCAAKRYKDVTWIVANGMRELPFADNSLDVILSVLAPRNIEEFARILKPEGALILGVPGPNHLIELRSELTSTASDFEEKADESVAKCAPLFKETGRELLSYEILLGKPQIADLIQMTPIFWNSSPKAKEKVQQLDELKITVSFALLTLQPA